MAPSYANSCAANFTPGGERLPFDMCNASLPIDARLDDLLARMTYEEKCAALDTGNPVVNRLGLPSLPGGEGLHGVASGCGDGGGGGGTGCPTSFPCATGLGAAFDTSLYGEVGRAIALEARALNNQDGIAGLYLFTPNINLARDPRWGRIQEVPSEDPYHASRYAVNYVRGLQEGDDPRYLQGAATAKHWLVYDLEGYIPRSDPLPRPASAFCDTPGGCERWNFDGSPPTSDLVSYYTPMFKAVVEEARVQSIMCSYNAAYGLPTCANDALNNGLIRDQWGFDGFIVSDCTAIELMQDVKWDNCQEPYPSQGGECTPDDFSGGHNYTFSIEETAHAALVDGGVDLNCGPFYKTQLYVALKNGAVTEDDVDRAARRVYETSIRLGLLDPIEGQYYATLPPETVDSPAHRALALKAACESLVLLKNDKSLLPLTSTAKFAFIGPHANATQDMLANYHGTNTLVDSHSPLLAARARGLNVTFARGCNICDDRPDGFPNMPCEAGHAVDRSMIDEAVAVAAAAEVAVVFVGNDQTSEAENFDRDNTTLPGVQEELLKAVVAANANTVVIMLNGGPVSSEWMAESVPSIIEAFYPGEMGGDALVGALIAEDGCAPAGRMPYTTYLSNFTATRDIRDVDLRSGDGITYSWFNGPVLWPFGHGLSYTSFDFQWSSDGGVDDISYDITAAAATTNHTVTVTNTGDRVSDCVVLAFAVSDGVEDAPEDAPLRELFAFERLSAVQPGESRTVFLAISAEALAVVDDDGRSVLRRGRLAIEVGDGAGASAPARSVVLTGEHDVVLRENEWARRVSRRHQREEW